MKTPKKSAELLDIDDHQLATRVNALIERGLERYGDGDLVGALSEWEHALALYPDAKPATQYIQYVRDNFALLEEQFEEAKRAAAVAAEAGLPIEEVGVGEAVEDDAYDEISLEAAYDSIELDFGDGDDTRSDVTPAPDPGLDDVDGGWVLDDIAPAAPLPPTPEEFDSPGLEVVREGLSGVDGGEMGDGRAEQAGEDALRRGLAPLESLAPAEDDADDETTVPGGDEPPPLPERPALSDAALAELDAQVDPELSAPPETPPDDADEQSFDLGELEQLDHGARDDRISDSEAGPEVRISFHEVGTSEKTLPARPSMTGAADDELTYDLGGPDLEAALDDDDQTRERSGWGERAPTRDPALSVIIDDVLLTPDADADAADGDDDQTRELLAIHDDEMHDQDAEVGTREFGGASGGPITGVRPASEVDAVSMDVVAAQLAAEIDDGAGDGEPEPERIRRRVTALLERARQEHAAGHYSTAVVALDMALEEAPDSPVSQKLVHGNRELLFRIFESYVGDLRAVPFLALPPHEIAQQGLDSRSAFLMSRIDGMLTFEDILDVAGMARMEAYRHLCRLLLRGILEVR